MRAGGRSVPSADSPAFSAFQTGINHFGSGVFVPGPCDFKLECTGRLDSSPAQSKNGECPDNRLSGTIPFTLNFLGFIFHFPIWISFSEFLGSRSLDGCVFVDGGNWVGVDAFLLDPTRWS